MEIDGGFIRIGKIKTISLNFSCLYPVQGLLRIHERHFWGASLQDGRRKGVSFPSQKQTAWLEMDVLAAQITVAAGASPSI